MLEDSISNDCYQRPETRYAGADNRDVWFQGGPDAKIDASPYIMDLSDQCCDPKSG